MTNDSVESPSSAEAAVFNRQSQQHCTTSTCRTTSRWLAKPTRTGFSSTIVARRSRNECWYLRQRSNYVISLPVISWPSLPNRQSCARRVQPAEWLSIINCVWWLTCTRKCFAVCYVQYKRRINCDQVRQTMAVFRWTLIDVYSICILYDSKTGCVGTISNDLERHLTQSSRSSQYSINITAKMCTEVLKF